MALKEVMDAFFIGTDVRNLNVTIFYLSIVR
jgi:hypothetical protein